MNDSEPVNDNNEFCAVFNADFGEGLKVLFRGEIDCLTPGRETFLKERRFINTFHLSKKVFLVVTCSIAV